MILGKVPECELNLTVGSNIIQPMKSVRDLGVQLDTELSMKTRFQGRQQLSTSCVVYGRSDFLSVRNSHPSWYPRSFFPGLTTVTLC